MEMLGHGWLVKENLLPKQMGLQHYTFCIPRKSVVQATPEQDVSLSLSVVSHLPVGCFAG